MNRLARHELLWLALWLLATIGLRPLMLPDEGRYAGVAFEMLAAGSATPLLNGLPYFHKPPLLYWLEGAAMQLLGVNAFAARLGPALMAWVLGAALFLHLRRWHGPAVARTGLLVLATCPFFFVGAQYVNHDMGVAACISAAVLAFVRALDEGGAPQRRWLLAGWAFCALGVLAKGLIGLVLPALIVLPWLFAQRRWRALPGLLHPLGLAVFAVIALPWLLAMQARFPAFFDYFIVEQHFRRYADTAFNNQQPPWFLFVALPLLMLPWSLWLWPALRRPGARGGLYLWWALVVLGFFSLPSSKLVGYALPALAPVAALLGLALALRQALWLKVGLVAGGLCVALVLLLAWRTPVSHRDLADALRARWQPGDRLVYIDDAFFDLRFQARLAQPAIVVTDWGSPDRPLRDDWRKELWDAARRFDPAGGAQLLWPWARLPEMACHRGAVWVLVPRDQLPRLAGLGASTVFEGRHGLLLQLAGRDCPPAALPASAQPGAPVVNPPIAAPASVPPQRPAR